MKHFLCLLCSLVMISGMFSACDAVQSNQTYEILVYGFSDAVPSVEHSIEYEFADREKFDDIEARSEIEITVQDRIFTCIYDSTRYYGSNYFPTYEYFDPEYNSFSVDERGKLISCFFGESESKTPIRSQEDCLQIAKDFVSNIVDISQYHVSAEIYSENDGEYYVVEFTKYIGDIKTTDRATVKVQFNGDIYSYSSTMFGRVPIETKTDDINFEDAKTALYNRLDAIYAEAKEKFDRVEYSEPIFLLTILKDGSRGLVCYVDISCIYLYSDGTGRISERINAVIPLD